MGYLSAKIFADFLDLSKIWYNALHPLHHDYLELIDRNFRSLRSCIQLVGIHSSDAIDSDHGFDSHCALRHQFFVHIIKCTKKGRDHDFCDLCFYT